MTARRIVTAVLFVFFALILELNQNTAAGWILLAAATVCFVILWEKGAFRRGRLIRAGSWIIYVFCFFGILFLTWPPVRRVPVVGVRDPAHTSEIEVTGGRVRGVLNGEGTVEIFAGIPYAAPPVGELRWREPQDPEPWEGVMDADSFGPMFMQQVNLPIYDSLYRIIGFHDYRWFDPSDNYRPAVSEESLTLNLFRPSGDATGLSVYVFVHGGSLQTGQTWFGDYRGEKMAEEGVIYVNFTYRLGVFGYLALGELADESPNGTTGNYGLLDQIKALQWVKDNIAAFGGDPDNVTLAGESAGSASVSALCTSPLAKGLFRRVVLESSTVASASPPHSFRLLDEALESGSKILELYGAADIGELRKIPAETIVASAATEHHMTVDGYALTETPYESYMKGIYNEEAVLHGFNSEESAPFLIFSNASMKDYEQRVRSYFKDRADDVLVLYPASDDAQAKEMWAEIYGAVFFDYPHYCLNRLELRNGIPVYEYFFTKENGRIGPYHSGEMIYLYGNLPGRSRLFGQSDRDLMKTAFGYILNFTKTGDPNGAGLPAWPQNADSRTLMELGETVRVVAESERKLALYGILDSMDRFGG